MENTISLTKQKMEKVIDTMQKRFTTVRAGRANASILDGIQVNYYGTDTPLMQLATISVPEARQIMIKPFDKGSISNIEKAIFEANIGLTPNNNGEHISLFFPPLTEERRKEFVKQVKEMSEEAKISLRTIRQDANNDIKKLEISEDEQKRGVERIQLLINDYNKKVEDQLKAKENELMTV